jgi:hypothetical protein
MHTFDSVDLVRKRGLHRSAPPPPNRERADSPAGEDLGELQKIEQHLDKREACRGQADAKKLGIVARIDFMRECMNAS